MFTLKDLARLLSYVQARNVQVHAEDWKDTDVNSVIKVIILNLLVYDWLANVIMLNKITINPNPGFSYTDPIENLWRFSHNFYIT